MYLISGVSEGIFEYKDYVVYEDQAENGDTILRYSTEEEAENNEITDYSTNSNIIMLNVTIDDDTKETYVIGTNSEGKYVTLYNSSAEPNSYSENFLCDLGDVIKTGTIQAGVLEGDFEGAKQNGEEYYNSVISGFENDFYNALLNYSLTHESAIETTETTKTTETTETTVEQEER